MGFNFHGAAPPPAAVVAARLLAQARATTVSAYQLRIGPDLGCMDVDRGENRRILEFYII